MTIRMQRACCRTATARSFGNSPSAARSSSPVSFPATMRGHVRKDHCEVRRASEKSRRRTMPKIALAAVSILILSFTFATVTLAQAPMIDGQVTRIDEAAGKITLKHGPIKKLDMNEGMTMVFRVQDRAMLKQVKVGDKVRFDADRINGQITVTKIEKAK